MRDVEIIVFDQQIYDTHSDKAENTYQGNLSFKDNAIYITYKEKNTSTTNMIKCKDNSVSVNRVGDTRGKLMFQVEKPYNTLYKTPYGSLDMEIHTQRCQVELLEEDVRINIEYKIIMQGKKVSENKYIINVH